MYDLFKEILEVPKELYSRGDSLLNEKIRPLTKKLDEKNKNYKYLIGNNATAYNLLDVLSGSQLLGNPLPFGFSFLNFVSNNNIMTSTLFGLGHKGYTDNSDGNRCIDRPIICYSNVVSKSTRFISVIEGISQIGLGAYFLFVDKEPSSLVIINNGLCALNVGLGTFVFQANDDEPREKKRLFSKTKDKLEKLLEKPQLQPIQ